MFGRLLSCVAQGLTIGSTPLAGGAWSLVPVRQKIRVYFPRPSETKRINKHGWLKRMSTSGGRRVLMNRILKQRHVLSH